MGYTTGHQWTEWDENFLRENYLNRTNTELAAEVRVSGTAVEHKLHRLRLVRPLDVQLKHRTIGVRKSPKVREHMHNLGKRVQGDPALVRKRIEAYRKSEKVKKYLEIAGSRLRLPENRKKNLEALKNSQKVKEKGRIMVRRIMSDPLLNSKRLANMRKVKSSEEHRIKISGQNHWNWNGGLSFEPYPIGFNHILKDKIRGRDEHRCQICGAAESEGNKLSIHHIDYNKNNLEPPNLISLCRSCHSKTNHYGRPTWRAYFRGKVLSRISTN